MRSHVVVSLSLLLLAVPAVAVASTPNDPRVGEQWGIANTGQTVRDVTGIAGVDANLPAAWNYVKGGNAVVAVAGTGIDMGHPDLAANVWLNPGETGTTSGGQDRRTNNFDDDGNGKVDDWRGWDFVSNDNDPTDLNGSGTMTAGIVGAVGNNGIGITGVAQTTQLMALRIGGSSRLDNSVNVAAAAQAIAYAGAKGADVFLATLSGGASVTEIDDAIAANPQMLFVFQAGSSGASNESVPSFPCNFNRPNVICTTAITSQGALPAYANRGVTKVDLAAPGSAILTTSPFTTTFEESFEAALAGRWSEVPSLTDLAWGVSTSPSLDGSKALTISNNSASVPSSTQSAITSPRVDLAGCVSPVLHLSSSSGMTNGAFQVLVTENANANSTASWVPLISISGTSGMSDLTTDLSGFAGKNIALVLAVSTSSSNGGTGPVVDELKITCRPNVYTGVEYDWMRGPAAAAAMVAGTAALVASQYPDADSTYLRNAILNSTTPMPSLAGNTVTGGRLNALAAIDTTPPAAFAVKGPADGSASKDTTPAFTFNGTTDDKTGIARYELMIDGKLAGTTNSAGRSITPAKAIRDGAHQWRIDAVNGAGLRRSTSSRTIKVGDAKPPQVDADTNGSTSHATISSKGLTVSCDLSESGKCSAEVSLSKSDAKKLGLKLPDGAKSLVIAKASKKTNAKGEAVLKLKPDKKARNAIKASDAKITFKITVTATDKVGNARKVTLTVRS